MADFRLRIFSGGCDRAGRVMAEAADNGVVTLASRHTVAETVERLEEALRRKGIPLFALIDHSGEAEKAGLRMPPAKVLIFGNPKAGTPVMVAAPGMALDLPLKILVWEDAAGRAWVSYNSLAYLQARHGVPAELMGNLAAVEVLAAGAAG